ncbi:MAG: hypothetical protein M0C28_07710 [Candidatus Moduliflexus flocculans]|nr:hypothetical protein [Candidatus Moduliflexus flocculans]
MGRGDVEARTVDLGELSRELFEGGQGLVDLPFVEKAAALLEERVRLPGRAGPRRFGGLRQRQLHGRVLLELADLKLGVGADEPVLRSRDPPEPGAQSAHGEMALAVRPAFKPGGPGQDLGGHENAGEAGPALVHDVAADPAAAETQLGRQRPGQGQDNQRGGQESSHRRLRSKVTSAS